MARTVARSVGKSTAMEWKTRKPRQKRARKSCSSQEIASSPATPVSPDGRLDVSLTPSANGDAELNSSRREENFAEEGSPPRLVTSHNPALRRRDQCESPSSRKVEATNSPVLSTSLSSRVPVSQAAAATATTLTPEIERTPGGLPSLVQTPAARVSLGRPSPTAPESRPSLWRLAPGIISESSQAAAVRDPPEAGSGGSNVQVPDSDEDAISEDIGGGIRGASVCNGTGGSIRGEKGGVGSQYGGCDRGEGEGEGDCDSKEGGDEGCDSKEVGGEGCDSKEGGGEGCD
ncbi:unnamed protein product, partial [Closterium sp. NIES-53]